MLRLLSIATLLLLTATTFPSNRTLEKEAIARAIFERLVDARGDNRMPKPRFAFSKRKEKGAKFSGDLITLEEAAYDVCAALGDRKEAALAGLLAHEIIHYYEKHTWENGFINLVAGANRQEARNLRQSVKEDLDAFKKDEIEADYMGGFLAHMAGYPTTEVMPDVLDGLYEAYELDSLLPKYP
ncbi:MAG: hypothetical protein AAFU03_18505, partial [Bacteroidota bacterium]